MYNKQWLSETLAEKFETQNMLHVGQIIKIGDREEIEGSRENKNRSRKGTVIGLYKNHFLVEFGKDIKYKESFNYMDIITSITNYADANNRGGERFFSAKFGREYKQIEFEMIPFPVNLESQSLVPKKAREKRNKENYRTWTAEQVKYIMQNKDSCLRLELTDDFNLKFGTKVTRPQINAVIQREVQREKVKKLKKKM